MNDASEELALTVMRDDVRIERNRGRVVGPSVGVFLTSALFDRQAHEWTFTLNDAETSPLFVGRVKRRAFGEDPTSGGATSVTYIVTEAWFPRFDGMEPERWYRDTMWMDVLAKFLKVHNYLSGVKTPDSVFAFEDARPTTSGRSRSRTPRSISTSTATCSRSGPAG